MSKENYNRLFENQKATLNNVEAYVSEQEPAQAVQDPVQIRQLLDDPLKAQLLLQISRDAALGVVTSVVQNKHGDGTEDLVRDARSQVNQNKDQAARCSRSMDVLNTFRAAQKLLELEGRRIDPTLRTLAETQLKAIFDPETKQRDNKKFNTDLVLALKKLGVKEAESKLSVARDFASLDNPQYHISTITEQTDKAGKLRVVVESNNMLLGLTDELRRQYTTIAGNDEAAKAKIDWYNKLPEFDKQLVGAYAAKIAKGGTMIPTQLRGHLPGIRNAYAKSSFVQTAGKGFKKVLETLQAGTISFHGKGDRVAHTRENLEQLDSFLPEGRTLNINPLNSPEMLPGIANLANKIDKSAPGLIRKAQGQRAREGKLGSISVTPFNIARRTTYNDNSGFDKALYEIGTKLLADNKAHAIASFLKDGRNEQAAKDQLASLKKTNPELAQALGHAMTAKHLIVHPHGMMDPQNSNLELSPAMNIVSFQCTQGVLSRIPGLNVELILSHCASGKDRGGLLPTKTSHEAVSDALGLDGTADKKVMEENLGKQISAGHTQVVASINGGTPGCHGIKSESLTACPKGSKYTSLYEETADNNKFKTKKTVWQKVKKAAKFMAAIPAGIVTLAASPLIAAYVAAKSLGKRGYSTPSPTKHNESKKR
jgi:hypothetical protein